MPGAEDTYLSRCMVDKEGAQSERLQVNHCTLKAGKKLEGGSHAKGYDECYFVLHGRAKLALGGDPQSGEGSTVYEIGPETAIFIPGGTFHALSNPFAEDLVFLTLWPKLPAPGVNPIYDARLQAWGTSFRTRETR
jgi:mannose-6-phosphate isomerase-like protein (cupin superfamily)